MRVDGSDDMKRLAIGIMSGTSMDGIDAALVELDGSFTDTRLRFLAGRSDPFSAHLVTKLKRCIHPTTSTAELMCSVHFELALAYADTVRRLLADVDLTSTDIAFVACHGQTIYHINALRDDLVRSSLQLGDGSVLAQVLGIPTVSNFRNADIAHGGTGAPLVPYADFVLFQHDSKTRVLHNIGGISNITILPECSTLDDVIAFDTGPGNMMIDDAMRILYGREYDHDGSVAASGIVRDKLLDHILGHPFFALAPPKSTGREQFGIQYTEELIERFDHLAKEDIIATLTEAAAQSMADALQRYAPAADELIVSGGGAANIHLVSRLQARMPDLTITTTDDHGIPAIYKEAIAFAVLGNETMQHKPSNVPGATGASRSVVLGQIAYTK